MVKSTKKGKPEIVEAEVVKTPPNPPAQKNAETEKQQTKKSGGNKALKIGLGICLGCLAIIIIIVIAIFVGGGLFLKNTALPFFKDIGKKVETEIETQDLKSKIDQGGNLLEKIPTIANTNFQQSENKLPANFPSDFPIYPGSKIGQSTGGAIAGREAYLVKLESTDNTTKVINFYKSNLPTSGWAISAEYGDSKSMVYTVKKGKDNGLVTITQSEDNSLNTTINIVINRGG